MKKFKWTFKMNDGSQQSIITNDELHNHLGSFDEAWNDIEKHSYTCLETGNVLDINPKDVMSILEEEIK